MAETTPKPTIVIRRFRSELERIGIRVEQVLLFGSYARGEAREDSDIDLIVVSADWIRYSPRERLELLGIVAARIMESVQAQGFTPQEISEHRTGAFWEDILKHHAVTI